METVINMKREAGGMNIAVPNPRCPNSILWSEEYQAVAPETITPRYPKYYWFYSHRQLGQATSALLLLTHAFVS